MVGEDIKISSNGEVTGTIKYIKNFTEFNPSNDDEQKGNFFPVTLQTTGSKMTIKKNDVDRVDKKDIPFDKNIILRVTKTDKFTIIVDENELIKFSFESANLLTQ